MKRVTHSPIQTFQLGKKLAKNLKGGDIITLSGELGAGKTVFIKGLAAGLGVKQTVRSPSFNLLKIYTASKKRQFVHVDCYRLKSPIEAIEIGLFDFLAEPKTIVAIEWPEKIKILLKKYHLKKIKISTRGGSAFGGKNLKENCRQIIIPSRGLPRR